MWRNIWNMWTLVNENSFAACHLTEVCCLPGWLWCIDNNARCQEHAGRMQTACADNNRSRAEQHSLGGCAAVMPPQPCIVVGKRWSGRGSFALSADTTPIAVSVAIPSELKLGLRQRNFSRFVWANVLVADKNWTRNVFKSKPQWSNYCFNKRRKDRFRWNIVPTDEKCKCCFPANDKCE